MAKATTIKEAIKKWEEKTGLQAATATEVSLVFQWPPIEKMDSTLATLIECEWVFISDPIFQFRIKGMQAKLIYLFCEVCTNRVKPKRITCGCGQCFETYKRLSELCHNDSICVTPYTCSDHTLNQKMS